MANTVLYPVNILIRPFEKTDTPELLKLMRELAKFEEYDLEFAVTHLEIEKRGLNPNPQFYALVAELEGLVSLAGMAVIYVVPYTFTLKPDMVLKELFVDERARGLGVGAELFKAVKNLGKTLGCQQVLWKVLAGNSVAESFYRKQGGAHDKKWHNWVIKLD